MATTNAQPVSERSVAPSDNGTRSEMALEDSPECWEVAVDIQLEDLRDGRFGFNLPGQPGSSPGHFRLLDCRSFLKEKRLKILESKKELDSESMDVAYTAVSYIWKGQPLKAEPAGSSAYNFGLDGYFSVIGAEEGDPISIAVLRELCLASVEGSLGLLIDQQGLESSYVSRPKAMEPANYLWLDQLCIEQTSDEDKNKQIYNMYKIYSRCAKCVIAPGGLQRLVPLDEKTEWNSRAWTLQECIAPSHSFVLFSWQMESCPRPWIGNGKWRLAIFPLQGCSALASFEAILRSCQLDPLRIESFHYVQDDSGETELAGPTSGDEPDRSLPTPEGPNQREEYRDTGAMIDVQIFGKKHPDLTALQIPLYMFHTGSESLGSAHCYSAIWRCTLRRASSRPRDMILSLMGLVGVRLNPSQFKGDDRLGATVALAKAILDTGGNADWLGVAPSIPHSLELATFPQFPMKTVDGQIDRSSTANIDFEELIGQDWVLCRRGWRFDHPLFERQINGHMRADGCLTFIRETCIVEEISPPRKPNNNWCIRDFDGNLWHFKDASAAHRRLVHATERNGFSQREWILAVPMWSFDVFSRQSPNLHDNGVEQCVRFMLINSLSDVEHRIKSYGTLEYDGRADIFSDDFSLKYNEISSFEPQVGTNPATFGEANFRSCTLLQKLEEELPSEERTMQMVWKYRKQENVGKLVRILLLKYLKDRKQAIDAMDRGRKHLPRVLTEWYHRMIKWDVKALHPAPVDEKNFVGHNYDVALDPVRHRPPRLLQELIDLVGGKFERDAHGNMMNTQQEDCPKDSKEDDSGRRGLRLTWFDDDGEMVQGWYNEEGFQLE